MLVVDRVVLVILVLGDIVFWAYKGVVEGGFAVPADDVGVTVSFFVFFLQASEITVIVFPDNPGCSLTCVVGVACVLAELAEGLGGGVLEVGGKGGDWLLEGFCQDPISFCSYHANHLWSGFACPIPLAISFPVCS